MSFAIHLRRLRNAKGLTQEQLAHACGFAGQSRIANYEGTGPHAREPSLAEVPVIAHALGVSVGELFGEPAPLTQSQAARLDPAKVAETVKALRTVFARRGATFDVEADPELFVAAYAVREEMEEAPSPENLIEFGMKLADMAQGISSDERGNGLPSGSTHRAKAGKRASAKT